MNKILTSVMSIGVAGVMMSAATFAVFTASASNLGNVFTAGTLNLTTNTTSALFSLGNMKPGDTVSRELVVQNPGTLNLTYNAAVNTTGDTELVDALKLQVLSGGTPIYGPDGSMNGTIFTGRTLNTATNETLNFTVSLPNTTTDSAQGKNATANFTFSAQQQL